MRYPYSLTFYGHFVQIWSARRRPTRHAIDETMTDKEKQQQQNNRKPLHDTYRNQGTNVKWTSSTYLMLLTSIWWASVRERERVYERVCCIIKIEQLFSHPATWKRRRWQQRQLFVRFMCIEMRYRNIPPAHTHTHGRSNVFKKFSFAASHWLCQQIVLCRGKKWVKKMCISFDDRILQFMPSFSTENIGMLGHFHRMALQQQHSELLRNNYNICSGNNSQQQQ